MAKTSGNAVWNYTIPHTSPMIEYWYMSPDCPEQGGFMQCTQNGTDYAHVLHPEPSSTGSSEITLQFHGTAIYVYGTANNGVSYTVGFDGVDPVPATPDGDLLFKSENLSNLHGPNLHRLTFRIKRNSASGELRFTHADVSVDTGVKQASAERTSFSLDDARVTKSADWITNGTYWEAKTDFEQTGTVKFEGSAIFVYGFCSNTRPGGGDSYGEIKTDDNPVEFVHATPTTVAVAPYVADNCLIYWDTNLTPGNHTLQMETDKDPVMISRFDVLTVKNGTGNNNGGGGDPNSNSSGVSIGSIVGIAAGVIVLLILAGIFGFCLFRRNRARRAAMPQKMARIQLDPNMESGNTARVALNNDSMVDIGNKYPPAPSSVSSFASAAAPVQSPHSAQPLYPPSAQAQNQHFVAAAVSPAQQPPAQLYMPQHRPEVGLHSPVEHDSSSVGHLSHHHHAIHVSAGEQHTNAAHFAGRVVLSAEGQHSYTPMGPTKERPYVGTINRVPEHGAAPEQSSDVLPPGLSLQPGGSWQGNSMYTVAAPPAVPAVAPALTPVTSFAPVPAPVTSFAPAPAVVALQPQFATAPAPIFAPAPAPHPRPLPPIAPVPLSMPPVAPAAQAAPTHFPRESESYGGTLSEAPPMYEEYARQYSNR